MAKYNYKYKVYDLDKNPVLLADSMVIVAKCMGVGIDTVEYRLKNRATKFSAFKSDKYKFNVIRELDDNNGNLWVIE